MRLIGIFLGMVLGLASFSTRAEEALCAEVKIEIMQELTMERQGFEALMRITNSLDTFSLENVSVKVLFKDANGNPVVATSNTSASNAAFFIRKDDSQDVAGLQEGADGYLHSGSIEPKKVGELRWLIIPTANAAGQTKDGKLFFVGAELRYSYGGKEEVVNVADDTIVVKPQPALTLDYFLTEEVVGDNGFTTEIEPSEPYTLGVRINNNGFGAAKSVKIESAQPRIVENKLGLAVNFKILGSYLKDLPSSPSLLINFGNIEPKGVTTGRWIMESNLAGTFKSFTASFTHADELGGELTSLLQATNANFLVHDVVMDLPGRDTLRDFLAYNATRSLRVFESEPTGATEVDCANCKKVTEISAATITPVDNSRSKIEFEPVGGLVYITASDSFKGAKALAKVVREDGSIVHPQNAWLSKKRAADNINFNYFINVFDNNSSGKYTVYWGGNLVDVPQPPVIQFIQDQITFEGGNLGFIVRATDPNKTLPDLAALQLPAGAAFNKGAVNEGIFNWSPLPGQAGQYAVTFTATDGEHTVERIVNIRVNPANDTDGDGMDDDWEREKFGNLDKDGTADTDGDGRTDLQEFEEGTDPNVVDAAPAAPEVLSPVYNADILDGEMLPLQPELVVTNGAHPAQVGPVAILFEVYKDEALTEFMGSATIAEGSGATNGSNTTHWKISPADLEEGMEFEDNKLYYWRAKTIQTGESAASSIWVKSQFFINTANDLPSPPQISSPAIEASIATLSPTLIITNSTDIDRDELRYAFELFTESDLEHPVATVSGLLAGNNGQTAWFIAKVLEEDQRYVWQASVTDEHNAVVKSAWGSFIVNTQNHAPSNPQIDSPQPASTVDELQQNNSIVLRVINSIDPERKPVQYYFELDKVNTFDSPDKKASPVINAGTSRSEWNVSGLTDDTHYFWRVKATDGEVESAWVVSDFTVNRANQPPTIPVLQNPVNGAVLTAPSVLLQANPSIDPEGSIVKYHIQAFADVALTQSLLDEVTMAPMWQFGPLTDKATYYWRMRAEDTQGKFSEWSVAESFTINLPPVNVKPQFTFVAPAQNVTQSSGTLLIQWQDSDPDSAATIKLKLKKISSSPIEWITIAENISEDLDADYDSFTLTVGNLASGIYNIVAEISDENHTETVVNSFTLTVPPPAVWETAHKYWRFDENGGDQVTTSDGQYSGTLMRSTANNVNAVKPQWVAGRKPGSSALSFASGGAYISLDNTITQTLLGDATLSFWLKSQTNGSAIIGSYIQAGEVGNSIGWGEFGAQWQIGVSVGGVKAMGLTPLNDNKWHQVVITRKKQPGLNDGVVKMYVDGQLDLYAEPKDSRFNGLLNTLSGVGLNARVRKTATEDSLIAPNSEFFKGTLDDLRMFNRALTHAEIVALYKEESGLDPATNGAYNNFASQNIYQAESASLYYGVIGNNWAGVSGLGHFDYYGRGSYVEWVVDSAYATSATLEFHYSNGSTIDRPLAISVNGTLVNANLSFPVTPNWTTWTKSTQVVNLAQGKNVIRAYVPSNSTANDGPNMDYLKIVYPQVQ